VKLVSFVIALALIKAMVVAVALLPAWYAAGPTRTAPSSMALPAPPKTASLEDRFEHEFTALHERMGEEETNLRRFADSLARLNEERNLAEAERDRLYRLFDEARIAYRAAIANDAFPITLEGIRYSREGLEGRLASLDRTVDSAASRAAELERVHGEAVNGHDIQRERLATTRHAATIFRHHADAAFIEQDHERAAELIDNIHGLTQAISGAGLGSVPPTVDNLIKRAAPSMENFDAVLNRPVPEHARAPRPQSKQEAEPESPASTTEPPIAITPPAVPAQLASPARQAAPRNSPREDTGPQARLQPPASSPAEKATGQAHTNSVAPTEGSRQDATTPRVQPPPPRTPIPQTREELRRRVPERRVGVSFPGR